MKVGLGGTFNVFHRGHRRLLEVAAAQGDRLLVGLMTNEYCLRHKDCTRPFEQREVELRQFLDTLGRPYEIVPLETWEGTAPRDPELGVLVVSEETRSMGSRINAMRRENGLPPLRLEVVPCVLAEDFRPISSSRILAGEIDMEGGLRRPLMVMVGSLNPIKTAAVREVLRQFHPLLEVRSVEVPIEGAEQPWDEQAERGALSRAKACLGEGDLGVGIEAGVLEREDGLYDVQHCAIIDAMGRVTKGHGMGFRYPPALAERVRQGASVGEACAALFDEGDQGSGMGAIGILTRGVIDRKRLTEQAVLAAMVPRIRKELYW
ncbi:MAG: inosine/xanthosine triphosphatase [Methanomassiliicoccales archaeon]|nr:inosine/xanthosine triphosphatase [Methanomassiliicoccales archaeon]